MEDENRKPIAVFYAYEQSEVDTYSHATNYLCALYDIENRLRADYKYGDESKVPLDYIEKLRDFIGELKVQYHLPED